MKKVGTAVENFAFKAFDFNGRATLLEYWLMMPLVWGFIIFLFVGDVVELWGFLLAREVPPFNPLYWDSLLVFFLTLIPRMSLTVRRLHDSGKSGKWVKLPFTTVTSGFVACVVIGIALATTNLTSGMSAQEANDASALAGLGMVAFIWGLTNMDGGDTWPAIFATAAMINAIGFDAILHMAAEIFAPPSNASLAAGASNFANGVQSNPGEGLALMLIPIFLVATPFVTGFLHVFFMISPSKPDHDLDNHVAMSGASLRRKGDVSDNPFAGYKYLYAKSPEQEEAAKAKAKEEIKSLYQQRVLGGGQPV